MDDNKTAAQAILDELRMKYREWRIAPGSGKAAAQAAFVEAGKLATTVLEPRAFNRARIRRL
jgi:hypothetical protein